MNDAAGDAALTAFDQAKQVMDIRRSVLGGDLRSRERPRTIEVAPAECGDCFSGP